MADIQNAIDEFVNSVSMQCIEQREAFVFHTVSSYMNNLAPDLVIEKQELVKAIEILREIDTIKRQSGESYTLLALGQALDNARKIEGMVHRAYNLGYADGVEYEKRRISDAIKEDIDD